MEYYNLDCFKRANVLFEEYIDKLQNMKKEIRKESCFNITTLTATCLLTSEEIDASILNRIYEQVDFSVNCITP